MNSEYASKNDLSNVRAGGRGPWTLMNYSISHFEIELSQARFPEQYISRYKYIYVCIYRKMHFKSKVVSFSQCFSIPKFSKDIKFGTIFLLSVPRWFLFPFFAIIFGKRKRKLVIVKSDWGKLHIYENIWLDFMRFCGKKMLLWSSNIHGRWWYIFHFEYCGIVYYVMQILRNKIIRFVL